MTEIFNSSDSLPRTKLEQQRSLQEDLDTERNQASKMREKLQQTSAELQSIKALEKQLNHEIEKHRDIIENLRDELREVKYDSERTAGASRAQLEQHKMNWSDERQQYQNRIDNLDKQVKDTLKKVHEQETLTKKVGLKIATVKRFCLIRNISIYPDRVSGKAWKVFVNTPTESCAIND